MKHTLQIFINNRFWKEVDSTVDAKGNYDFSPAITEVTNAQNTNAFLPLQIRRPLDLVSVEIRPVFPSEVSI
jgi:hypothetical protein